VSAARRQLAEAVAAVEILSPTRFAWLGQPSEELPPHVERALAPADARGFLVYALENRLYADFYATGGVRAGGPASSGEDGRGDPALVATLSGANVGTGCWEPGWTYRGRDGGELLVERGGLTLRALPHECRGLPPEKEAAGAPISILLPNELLRSSPGFYMALAREPVREDHEIVRLYWNVDMAGAVPFVAAATRIVDERGIPARLKVGNHPARFDRCDVAVLYVEREALVRERDCVAELHAALAGHLGPAVPALTRVLAPGVGLGDDPGAGRSFGQDRCRLIAEGIVIAYERGAHEPRERVAAVEERFAAAGLDPAAPHLRAGAEGDYDIDIPLARAELA
jgi:hypothetical protein